MNSRALVGRFTVAIVTLLTLSACDRDLDLLEPAPFPNDADIFTDALGPGLRFFEPFSGSKQTAYSIDTNESFRGSSSIRFEVPAPGDPEGGYVGGALPANVPRDLSGFNALTFWAKSSVPFTLDVVGLGNDNTGTSKFTAQVDRGFEITPSWTKFVVPIPDPSKLTQEAGMIFFAEGSETGGAYFMWMDEVRFEKLNTLANARPAIPNLTLNDEIGASITVAGATVTTDVNGADVVTGAAAAYFAFSSADPSVATTAEDGTITLVGGGSTTITASLGGIAASGTVTVTAAAPPTGAAPTPEVPAEEVVSLFSDAYTDVTVDTWSADWDNATVADVQIGGNNTKKYTGLGFAGVEMTSAPVDISGRSMMHVDVWTQDASDLRIRLVDFGADGVFGGGDDSAFQISLNETSTPALSTGGWNSLDIPISGMGSRTSVAQMVIEGASATLYLDNIYFHGLPPAAPMEPEVAAPTPTYAPGAVVSMFSNAYTNVTVDTWSASWDAADVTDVQIAGNDVKKYSNLSFAGIEIGSAPIDASSMTNFRMDFWTPDATADPAVFKVKIVDWGADGAFAGGDDVEHEVFLTAASTPAIGTGSWVTLDIPLADFTGLTSNGSLAQFIISGDPNTVYIDNVLFYNADFVAPTEPTTAAPVPTYEAGNVVSLFSNAYTNVTVDTWSASWDVADVADVQVAGDDVKKYTGLSFAGIEAGSAPIDASGMTHFRVDFWTPDATADPAVFKIKIVDWGADGAFAGGDDVEHEVFLTAASTPAIGTGQWITLDIPLADFTNLTTRGSLAQFIISGDPNTVFIDNVLFHN